MAAELTIADVYEDASLIGQDIEKIIEHFGHDAMTDLMPKIVRVLEKLEIVVGEKEKDKLEIAELKLENERLYLDIKREASQRRRLDEVGFTATEIIGPQARAKCAKMNNRQPFCMLHDLVTCRSSIICLFKGTCITLLAITIIIERKNRLQQDQWGQT